MPGVTSAKEGFAWGRPFLMRIARGGSCHVTFDQVSSMKTTTTCHHSPVAMRTGALAAGGRGGGREERVARAQCRQTPVQSVKYQPTSAYLRVAPYFSRKTTCLRPSESVNHEP